MPEVCCLNCRYDSVGEKGVLKCAVCLKAKS